MLTTLWVGVSFLGIFLKRFSTILHVLSFAIVDFTTLFFAGAALYKILPTLSTFAEWHWLKQAHVSGGCIFLLLVILQHLGGLTAFLGKKSNPQHRGFGRYLALIGRIIASVGWILGQNLNMTNIITIISSAIVLYESLLEGKLSKPKTE